MRTLEIVISIRNPDYRPSCSCLFAPLIEILLCLQAVTQDFMGELIIPYLLPFLVQFCIIEILES